MLRRRDADHDGAREGDQTAGEKPARKPFVENDAGENGDEDRPDVHEHRRGSGVDAPLGLVQDDAVDAEPEDAEEHDARQISLRRQRFASRERQCAERNARDDESRIEPWFEYPSNRRLHERTAAGLIRR